MNGSPHGGGGPVGDEGALGGPDGKSGKMALTPAPDNRWGVFVTGAGEFASVGDTSNARGYDMTTAGFTLGVDYKVTPHFVIGLAAGYDNSSADLAEGGRMTVDGGKFALYSSYFTGGFYADAAVQGGYNSYETSRSALEGTARGSTDGGEFSAIFGTGYDFKKGGLSFGPTANFGYTYLGLGSFTERGSLAPLSFGNQHQDSITSTFGAKASYDWKVGGVTVRPEVRVGWQHEYGDSTAGIAARFAGGSSDFSGARAGDWAG
jgi:outer membrane autotransporter protein